MDRLFHQIGLLAASLTVCGLAIAIPSTSPAAESVAAASLAKSIVRQHQTALPLLSARPPLYHWPIEPTLLAQEDGGTSLLETFQDYDYWFGLCSLKTLAEENDSALESCERALAIDPNQSDLWAIYSGVLLALQQFPEAIAAARQSQLLDPQSSLAIAQECRAFAALKEFEQALDACDLAIDLNGNWVNSSPALAWFQRGTILAQQGLFEVAISSYDRVLLLETDDSQTLTRRCQARIEIQDFGGAIEDCANALAGNGRWGDSSPAEAWFYQGLARSRSAQYQPAVTAFDRSISLDPNRADTWVQQGIALEQLERLIEARVSFEQAAILQPMSSRVQLRLCAVDNRLGDFESALAACTAAQAGDTMWREGELGEFWGEFGRALEGTNQFPEALAAVNRSVGIDPDSVLAWSNRAAVLWRLGELDEGLKSADRAIALDEGYATAWFNRALILQSQGNLGGALGAFNRAQFLAPEDAQVQANRSATLWLLGNFDGARLAASEAIQLDASSEVAWYNLGIALDSLGDGESALTAFEQVLQINPNNAQAKTAQGLVLAKLQRGEEATVVLQAVLQADPANALARSALEELLLPPPQPESIDDESGD